MLSSSLASMRHSGRQLSNTSQAPPAVFQQPSSQIVARSGTNPRNVTVNTSVTHRKRSKAEDSGCSDCNDCESLTPKAGAEVVCIKISLQGQLRRFRVPTPLSIDTIRTICQHCYGLNGDVALAYVQSLPPLPSSTVVSFYGLSIVPSVFRPCVSPGTNDKRIPELLVSIQRKSCLPNSWPTTKFRRVEN